MTLYYMALVGVSILGLFYDGYFFCFHMFHIIIGNDILIRVLQACLICP